MSATCVTHADWSYSSSLSCTSCLLAVSQTHLPSLRFFALHAISDTFLCGLVAVVFALAAFSSSNSVSSQLGHAFCEHLSRGNSLFGFVTSPGSGMENCEEKWQYGIAPLIMLAACVMLFVRAKTARAVWDYYRRMLTEGKISLESPSTSSIASSASSHSSSSTIHGEQYGEQQIYPYARATRSRKKRSETATSSSSSSGQRKPGHSRSSSSSTIRAVLPPGSASRIMLLPNDYSGAGLSPVDVRVSGSSSPSSPNMHTPRNTKSASAESVDTLRASHPLSGVRSASRHSPQPCYPQQHPYAPAGHTTSSSSVSHACVATNHSRKRSLSHGSGSGTDPQGRVVVYAPILMSIEEAQSLGGKEAVIEAAEAQAREALASTRVHGGDRHSSEGRRHRGPSPVLNQPPIFDSRGDPIYPVPRHYSQPPREAHPIQAASRTTSSKPRAQSTSAYEHHHHYYHASPRQQSDIEYVRSPREYSSHQQSTQYEQQVSQRFATSPQRGIANSRSPHRSRSSQTTPTLPPHQLGDNKSAAFTAIKGFRDESATEMVALRHPSHKTQ